MYVCMYGCMYACMHVCIHIVQLKHKRDHINGYNTIHIYNIYTKRTNLL